MATVENVPGGAASASPAPPPGVGAAPWPWPRVWPAVVVAAAFVPLLALQARLLWARPHYQFFPLVLPAAAALAWRDTRHLGKLDPGPARRWRLTLAAGWALLGLGVLFVSPGLGEVGALVTLLAAADALGGARLVRTVLPAWALLWLAVPLPRRFDGQFIAGLQSLVSRWASQALDTFGIVHMMEGNVVEVPGRRLLVDQACSGIYSLLTLLVGTLLYGMWNRASWLRTAYLMAASAFWVVAGNVTRVVAVVGLSVWLGIDASQGKKHTAIGLVVFALMLLMVAASDRLYAFVAAALRRLGWRLAGGPKAERPDRLGLAPKPGKPGAPAPKPAAAAAAPAAALGEPTRLPDPRRTWLGSVPAAAAFGLLLLPQWLMPGVRWGEVLTANDIYGPAFGRLAEADLPAEVEGFQRVGFQTAHRERDDSWGENSRAWFYRKGYRGASVSVDYQFVDWHDLVLCYTSNGWDMTARHNGAGDDDDPADRALVSVDFVNPEGWYGLLIYGMYYRDGSPMSPPEAAGLVETYAQRLTSWVRDPSRNASAVARLSHQVQLFVESESPLTPADRDQALALFRALRREIQKRGLGAAAEAP